MENALRKRITIIFAVLAIICLCAVIALAGLKNADRSGTAANSDGALSSELDSDTNGGLAAEPSVCDGNHEGYTEITSAGGELGADGTETFYYLTENTKLTNNITITSAATVTICLNGYVLAGNGKGSVIKVENSGATLTICDCKSQSKEAKHKHYYTVDANGLFKLTDENGDFLAAGDKYIIGGAITGGIADGGAGIYITGGTVNVCSGTICGNSAAAEGGGINRESGVLNMTGGAIRGNYASNMGGGVQSNFSTGKGFTFSGGSISENKTGHSGKGGGVSSSEAFVMSNDAEIVNNEAGEYGGGVFGSINMTGGKVNGNIAGSRGGGICICNNSSLSGGEICNNVIKKSRESRNSDYKDGAGILLFYSYGYGTEFTVSGNPKVLGNNIVYPDEPNLLNNLPIVDNIMTIGRAMTEGACIGISAELSADGSEKILTQTFRGHNGLADAGKYFISDNEHYRIYNNGAEAAMTDNWLLNLNLYKNRADEYIVDTVQTTYKYGADATTLRIPERGGYNFVGWYADESLSGAPVEQIEAETFGNLTFYAKWEAVSENNLFGGENIKYGKNNLWDCQRSPVFPLNKTPFYVYGLKAPLDVTGKEITFNDGDYVRFELYSGGGTVADENGDGLITVSELSEADRDRIANSIFDVANPTSKDAILNAVVVSEMKYDASGQFVECLAETGLIWALGDLGFLYTALDPNYRWSESGGVGTYITFDARKAGDSLQYVPDSPDPLDKDAMDEGGDGEKVVPVPTPETVEPAESKNSLVGRVIDLGGKPLGGTLIRTATMSFGVLTDGDGYFAFDVQKGDIGSDNKLKIEASHKSPQVKSYVIDFPVDGLVIIVYDTSSDDQTANDKFELSLTFKLIYKNMEGATQHASQPSSYTGLVATELFDPTKTCHTFGGWYLSEDFSGAPLTNIPVDTMGDITLFAKWTESHTWGAPKWTWDGTISATAKFTCEVCGATHTEPAVIQEYVIIGVSCFENGQTKYTATVLFNETSFSDEKTVEIPAPEHHSFLGWTQTKPATCTENGSERRFCGMCGEMETRDIPALGHSFGEWSVTKAATCAEKGTETRTCSVCGEVETRDIPKLAHTFGEWSVTKAATCAEKGTETRTCSVCGEVETRDIPKLSHTFGEWSVTKAATCAEKGTETRTCSVCGEVETRDIPKLAHTFGEWEETKPATDKEDGEETRTCSVCGEKETRAIPKKEGKSLLWLIILLAIILAAESVVLVLRVRARKKKDKDNSEKLTAVLPILAAVYPMGETAAVSALAAAILVEAVAIACTFMKKNEETPEPNGEEIPEEIEGGAEETEALNQDVENEDSGIEANGETAQTPETAAAEEPEAAETEHDEEILESELMAELESEEETVPEIFGVSLKESLALAAVHAKIKINKQSVADWLSENYGKEVIINRRANKTRTGLPLADTHYVNVGAKKKCFVYVFELDDEKSMLLLKTDDETAKEIAEKYPTFVKSRFPKSRREQWYLLIPDSGFNSADEVFDVIALILSKYTESLRSVSEDVRQEIAKLEELKKSNVSAEEAKELVSDIAATVLVFGKKSLKSGRKTAVNIDTLSERFEADEVVDLDSLKAKGIIGNNVKQVKILARGILDKPLTVIADDYSADAIKMIILTGGEAHWS